MDAAAHCRHRCATLADVTCDLLGRHDLSTPVYAGPLTIAAGRHPLLEAGGALCTPNDVLLAPGTPLQVLTGPNMSGKSTHLTMVGSLTVLAHLGSHVPAAACTVPLRRRVVLRAGAAGAGGLFAEAGQLAAALEVADDRALVLLDEVGYATGTADGLALAWAVAEALLERGALSLLATHLLELRRVVQVYPTATHAALEVGCQRM